MIALLYKDWVLIRRYTLFILFLLVSGFFLKRAVLFALTALVVPILAFDADVRNHALPVYLAMPICAKEYVLSKYLLALTSMIAAAVPVFLSGYLLQAATDWSTLFDASFAFFLPMLAMTLSFPIVFSQGMQSLPVFALVQSFAVNFCIFGGTVLYNILFQWIETLNTLPKSMIFAYAGIGVLFILSCRLSVFLFERYQTRE